MKSIAKSLQETDRRNSDYESAKDALIGAIALVLASRHKAPPLCRDYETDLALLHEQRRLIDHIDAGAIAGARDLSASIKRKYDTKGSKS